MTLRSSQRDREAAERALDQWGAWRGLAGSLELRDAVVNAIEAERERIAKFLDRLSYYMTDDRYKEFVEWFVSYAAEPIPESLFEMAEDTRVSIRDAITLGHSAALLAVTGWHKPERRGDRAA